MKTSESLPTKLAKILAIGVDLYIPDRRQHEQIDDFIDLKERLAQFQQLAFATDFDTAMLVYLGHDMETDGEEKRAALQLIFDTTRDFLLGHVMGVMLDKLDSKIIRGSEAADISRLLLENFNNNGKKTGVVKKGMLVRFADMAGHHVDENGIALENDKN
jgi:hypothetical protein